MGGQQRARHLAGWGACWLLGVAAQLQERALSPAWVYAVALLGGLLCVMLAWRWPRWWLLLLVAALAMGAGASGWRASERLAQQLPPLLEEQDLQVTGVVAGLPQSSAVGLRFRFDIEEARSQGQLVEVPPQASLGWYVGWHEDATLSEPQLALRAGQRWRFTVRLRRPHGNINPNGFDYELHLFEQGVRTTGHVRADPRSPPELLERQAGYPVDRWRQQVRDAIVANVSDPRAAGVLAALTVGDQSAIERSDWQLFRDTGVAHLMSISGLHVTMFAWAAGLAIAWLWKRSTRAMLCVPAPWAGRWGGLLAAACYAVFSGWGVPAQHTVWMLAVVTVLPLLGRRWPWPMVLLTAAVVVSALDPWALLQPGFWLSFMAVGLLMASEPAQRQRDVETGASWRRRLALGMAGGLRTQVIATLGLTPLTLVFFQQVSLVGFIANLIAIPVVTLVVTPLALGGVLFSPLWQSGAAVQGALSAVLAWLAGWQGAVRIAPVAPWWAQAAGLCAAALAISPWPWRMRLLALPLVIPLLLPGRDLPAPGQFEMLAADVGQGSAVLVRTRGHLLVYDTGPPYSRDSDAGQRVLLPLLRSRGETLIHRLVLSHRDLDHVGGAEAVMRGVPVSELWSSLEPSHPLQAMAGSAMRCEAGQVWEWDGVRFEMLHPRPEQYERHLPSNAMSCVLRVSAAQGSVLLAGDVERLQEFGLVSAHREALRSDVLLVPHHGSRTSSTALFLDAVAPSIAIVQSGYRNRFGHPAADVLARFRERGIGVHASPTCGAWHWPAGVPPRAGRCEREVSRRYWRLPQGAE